MLLAIAVCGVFMLYGVLVLAVEADDEEHR